METGDETEGTTGCLHEDDDEEVVCSGEPPPDPLGGDHSAGPWRGIGAVGDGGPTYLDSTLVGDFK